MVSANVEQWDTELRNWIPDALVPIAKWIIEWESGGNASNVGDDGCAVGLFQIHHGGCIAGRPSKEQLLDPIFNIKYAAQSLGLAYGKLTDWGYGTQNLPLCDEWQPGCRFGALGNHPLPLDLETRLTGFLAGIGSGIPADGSAEGSGGLPGVGAVGGAVGAVGGAVGDAAGAVFDALNPIGSVLGGVFRIVQFLLNPQSWARIFITAGGVALIAFGLARITGADKFIASGAAGVATGGGSKVAGAASAASSAANNAG